MFARSFASSVVSSALVLAAALGVGSAAHAHHPRNAKIDNGAHPVQANFLFKFNVIVSPMAVVPPDTPPWYMWWPANANETMRSYDFQSSPYPGYEHPAYSGVGGGPIGYQPSSNPYHTVGYPSPGYPSQVPSYWYGR